MKRKVRRHCWSENCYHWAMTMLNRGPICSLKCSSCCTASGWHVSLSVWSGSCCPSTVWSWITLKWSEADWCFSCEKLKYFCVFCLVAISQNFKWVNLGVFFEVNLLFVSQKALNTTQFQAKKKKRPSEENTSDPSGKVDFSKLLYGFSSFKMSAFP